MTMNRRRPAKGFTFLEIMFVVVIIGILLALVGPRLLGRTEQARIEATRAQMRSIQTAISSYEMDLGRLPQSLDELVEEDDRNPQWRGPYLDSDIVPVDGWGREFSYRVPGERNRRSYDLWSLGSDGQDGTDDDITNWSRDRR